VRQVHLNRSHGHERRLRDLGFAIAAGVLVKGQSSRDADTTASGIEEMRPQGSAGYGNSG
jgi:hypothetical protein